MTGCIGQYMSSGIGGDFVDKAAEFIVTGYHAILCQIIPESNMLPDIRFEYAQGRCLGNDIKHFKKIVTDAADKRIVIVNTFGGLTSLYAHVHRRANKFHFPAASPCMPEYPVKHCGKNKQKKPRELNRVFKLKRISAAGIRIAGIFNCSKHNDLFNTKTINKSRSFMKNSLTNINTLNYYIGTIILSGLFRPDRSGFFVPKIRVIPHFWRVNRAEYNNRKVNKPSRLRTVVETRRLINATKLLNSQEAQNE